MGQRKVNSRALRQLAEDLIRRIAPEAGLPEEEWGDLATSLVRQWITYDGCAALFLGGQQVDLAPGRAPLGKPRGVAGPAPHGWLRQLTEDWKVSPDDLPEVIGQLNRGQSAEVVNADGVPLRLWVNPKEGSRGVEPLVREGFRPGAKRDYGKVAATALEQEFGGGLGSEETDELACSVAKQWQRHGGHACLFLDGRRQLHFRLTEHGDGSCEVAATRVGVDLGPVLTSLGLPPEALPELIARLNLGQEVELRDGRGTASVLWHDPQARRICVRQAGPARPAVPAQAAPALCPRCAAVLSPWREGERQQTCPRCGHTVALG